MKELFSYGIVAILLIVAVFGLLSVGGGNESPLSMSAEITLENGEVLNSSAETFSIANSSGENIASIAYGAIANLNNDGNISKEVRVLYRYKFVNDNNGKAFYDPDGFGANFGIYTSEDIEFNNNQYYYSDVTVSAGGTLSVPLNSKACYNYFGNECNLTVGDEIVHGTMLEMLYFEEHVKSALSMEVGSANPISTYIDVIILDSENNVIAESGLVKISTISLTPLQEKFALISLSVNTGFYNNTFDV